MQQSVQLQHLSVQLTSPVQHRGLPAAHLNPISPHSLSPAHMPAGFIPAPIALSQRSPQRVHHVHGPVAFSPTQPPMLAYQDAVSPGSFVAREQWA